MLANEIILFIFIFATFFHLREKALINTLFTALVHNTPLDCTLFHVGELFLDVLRGIAFAFGVGGGKYPIYIYNCLLIMAKFGTIFCN